MQRHKIYMEIGDKKEHIGSVSDNEYEEMLNGAKIITDQDVKEMEDEMKVETPKISGSGSYYEDI